MKTDRSYTKRMVKRAMFLLLGIFLLLIILLAIGWTVVRSDHPYVIERLQETALEKWNADLQLEGYELEFIEPFPLIKLQIKGLVLGGADQPDYPFLKINQADSQFNPWNLITGDFNAHPFQLDSVWIHMHQDSLQNRNFGFNNNKKNKEKRNSIDLEMDELPFIKVNYLDFNRQNEYRKQQQWVKLSHMSVMPERLPSGEWSANLQSDSYFETLLFNEENGPYLKNTQGKVNLNIALADRGKSILFDNSSLVVDKDQYLLSGQFIFDDINKLKLGIKHEGVMLSDALPLLSDNLQYNLRDFKVDQPIRANFTLNKDLSAERKGSIRVDFATSDANINFKDVETTDVFLIGSYVNDIDNDGIGDPSTAELVIDSLHGDIMGIIPTRLNGVISELLGKPQVVARAVMDIELPRLNPLLAANDKITFSDGNAYVNFDYQGNLREVLSSPFDEQNIKMKGDAIFTNISLETKSSIAPSPSLTGSMSFDENETRLEDLLLDWMGSQISVRGRIANLPEFLFYDDQALQSKINLHFDELDLNKFADASKPKETDQNNNRLTVESVENITRRIASNLNGEIDLKIDKLIYDTLYVTELHTHLSLYTPRLAEYIDSSLVNIQGLTANFMGHTPMEFDLRYTRDSITNILLGLDMPEAAETVNIFLPEDMQITNGDLAVHIDAEASLGALLNTKNLIKDIQLDGTFQFDQLDLELSAVELPIKKISGELIFDKEQLNMKEIDFLYEESPFEINGIVQDYTAAYDGSIEHKAKVDLSLKGDFISLRTTEPISTNPKKQDVPTPADMFRSLDSLFYYAIGQVDVYLDSVLTNDHKFQPFLLEAKLIPDLERTEHHRLEVDSFYLGLGEKNYLKGNLTIENPENPFLAADIVARMKFNRMGDFLSSDYIEFQEGYFNLDLEYEAPLYDTISAENYLLKSKVDGTAKIMNGKMLYNYRDFLFDDINGVFKFDQRALYIPNVDLKVNRNKIFASGECTDFFPFFIQPDQKVSIALALRSPHFDFGNFTVPEELGKDTLGAKIKTVNDVEQDSLLAISETAIESVSANKLSQTHGFIDQLLDKGSLDINTSIDKLVYNNFFAEALEGNMTMQSDTVQLHDMSMEVAEGNINVNGLIAETALHRPKMEIGVKLAGNNISEIFRQLDDFGQDAISYRHLEGIASADLAFRAQADANYAIIKESLLGDLRFQVTGGQFENIPALSELKGFMFKKRKLDDIVLDTLSVYASMRGARMYIEKFNVHSSPFDFDVEGIYDLDNRDSTSILMSVPMGNLSRRYINPEDLKTKKHIRKGPRIYIESRYKKGRYRFIWKPFVLRRKTKYKLPQEVGPEIEVDRGALK